MKNIKKTFAIFFLLVVSTSACAGEQDVAAKLKQFFPRFTVESIFPSPIHGLYEVVAGLNVIYFDPVSGHTIYGEMLTPTGIDLTAVAKGKVLAGKYSTIKQHLSAAIKVGSGPNEVIEIIDPDCPFCRRMNDFWKKRTDITRYVFLMPLTQLHPQAKSHTNYILSATDPGKALEEVESGKYDKTNLPTTVLNDTRIKAQSESLISGINGTPAYFINGAFVNGADVSQIVKHLKGGK